MNQLIIQVQPPTQVQAGAAWTPPVTVKVVQPTGSASDYFIQAVLLDQSKNVVEGFPGGQQIANPMPSGSSDSLVTFLYTFDKLSISNAGLYTIRLDLYWSTNNERGVELDAQVETSPVEVLDSA